MDPIFLELDEVLLIHRDQLQRYGGMDGVREMGLLQSALAAPAASFGGRFLHTDLCEMAAAYLFRVVCNHPFVDGNKRTGTVVAVVFLAMNGWRCVANPRRFEQLVLKVANGAAEKYEIADFFRQHIKKIT